MSEKIIPHTSNMINNKITFSRIVRQIITILTVDSHFLANDSYHVCLLQVLCNALVLIYYIRVNIVIDDVAICDVIAQDIRNISKVAKSEKLILSMSA